MLTSAALLDLVIYMLISAFYLIRLGRKEPRDLCSAGQHLWAAFMSVASPQALSPVRDWVALHSPPPPILRGMVQVAEQGSLRFQPAGSPLRQLLMDGERRSSQKQQYWCSRDRFIEPKMKNQCLQNTMHFCERFQKAETSSDGKGAFSVSSEFLIKPQNNKSTAAEANRILNRELKVSAAEPAGRGGKKVTDDTHTHTGDAKSPNRQDTPGGVGGRLQWQAGKAGAESPGRQVGGLTPSSSRQPLAGDEDRSCRCDECSRWLNQLRPVLSPRLCPPERKEQTRDIAKCSPILADCPPPRQGENIFTCLPARLDQNCSVCSSAPFPQNPTAGLSVMN